jgi:hypothetical protein
MNEKLLQQPVPTDIMNEQGGVRKKMAKADVKVP